MRELPGACWHLGKTTSSYQFCNPTKSRNLVIDWRIEISAMTLRQILYLKIDSEARRFFRISASRRGGVVGITSDSEIQLPCQVWAAHDLRKGIAFGYKYMQWIRSELYPWRFRHFAISHLFCHPSEPSLLRT
jgi:hypothetical protein